MYTIDTSYGFKKASKNSSLDAVIFLRGLGAKGYLNREIRKFLVGCGLEVHHFDRVGDVLLSVQPEAIDQYIRDIRGYIEYLISQGKRPHLFGSSFGGYLGLKIAESIASRVNSVVAIAPVVNPILLLQRLRYEPLLGGERGTLYLADNRSLQILDTSLIDNPLELKKVTTLSMIVCGGEDSICPVDDLNSMGTIENVRTVLIQGVSHLGIMPLPEVQQLVRSFYHEMITSLP